ncbi:MAG: hypothetical protein R3E95_22975 [Thiolinea sp.]
MEADPDILLIGQPTRGVDIGAIEFIHRQIMAMRDAGKAILVGVGGTGGNHESGRPHSGDVRRHDHHRRPAMPTPMNSNWG